MSDLISRSEYASKLVKVLDVLNKEYREALLNEDYELISAIQNQQGAYTIALRVLDNQPTAYDVDKVVEGLETDSSVKLYGSRNSDNYMIPVNRAIEIVKKDGVVDD